jgi:hypothetical protein
MPRRRALLTLATTGVMAAAALGVAGCGGGDDEEVRAADLAERVEIEVEAVLRDARDVLAALKADPALAHPDPEHDHADDSDEDHTDDDAARDLERARARSARRCGAAVAAAAREHTGYEAIGRAAVEGAGDVDCLSQRFREPWNVGDRTFFLRAYNTGAFAVGDYQFDGGEIGQSLGVGLPTETAVIFALIDLEVLWERLARLPLPEGADVVVTDSNGTVIARPTTTYAVGRSHAGMDPLTDAMLTHDAGSGTFEYERRDRVYAFASPALARGNLRVAAGVLP